MLNNILKELTFGLVQVIRMAIKPWQNPLICSSTIVQVFVILFITNESILRVIVKALPLVCMKNTARESVEW